MKINLSIFMALLLCCTHVFSDEAKNVAAKKQIEDARKILERKIKNVSDLKSSITALDKFSKIEYDDNQIIDLWVRAQRDLASLILESAVNLNLTERDRHLVRQSLNNTVKFWNDHDIPDSEFEKRQEAAESAIEKKLSEAWTRKKPDTKTIYLNSGYYPQFPKEQKVLDEIRFNQFLQRSVQSALFTWNAIYEEQLKNF